MFEYITYQTFVYYGVKLQNGLVLLIMRETFCTFNLTIYLVGTKRLYIERADCDNKWCLKTMVCTKNQTFHEDAIKANFGESGSRLEVCARGNFQTSDT